MIGSQKLGCRYCPGNCHHILIDNHLHSHLRGLARNPPAYPDPSPDQRRHARHLRGGKAGSGRNNLFPQHPGAPHKLPRCHNLNFLPNRTCRPVLLYPLYFLFMPFGTACSPFCLPGARPDAYILFHKRHTRIFRLFFCQCQRDHVIFF